MKSSAENRKITPFLRAFTSLEALVLLSATIALFIFPDFTRANWPWNIAPFNTRFLGAIYFGALFPVAMMAYYGRWSPARPALRGITTFTFIVLVVSVFYSGEFSLSSFVSWGWFFLYLTLPISGFYHLWLYRNLPKNHLDPTPKRLQKALTVAGYILGIYGLGLLIFPDTFSSIFPWKIDDFHSQLYSATFITGAVMSFTIVKFSTSLEMVSVGILHAVFGAASILGMYIVDLEVYKIDWTSLNTLIWTTFFALISIFGFWVYFAGRQAGKNKK
jgi:hypothetical protein